MPAYSKTNWVDGSVPAIDATNLNKIEQGIFDSLRQDGSTTMSGQLVTTAGSAATPAIAPTGDANTGIFFPAADTIAFGEGGTEVMRLTSAGNLLIGTTTDYTSTEKAGSVTIDGIATRNVTLNTGLSATQSNNALIIQNSTPFNGGNGSIGTSASGVYGIYVSPVISNDGSGGANQVSGNGMTSSPVILSSSSSARIALTCYTGNSLRNSVNDLSAVANNFLSGTQNSTGHGSSLPNTAVTGTALAIQGTVTNGSGTITNSTAALFRNSSGNTAASQVNTVTTATGVNADLLLGHATAGASSVTDYYAFRSTSTINASGTLTNFYGLHIGTPTVTGTLTNKWAIYSTDPNMKSYHAGNVGIGTTSPAVKFVVESNQASFGSSMQIINTGTSNGQRPQLAFYSGNTSNSGFLIGKNNTGDGGEVFLVNEANTAMLFITNGITRLSIEAGGTTRPFANNTYDLGSSTYRWATIYAQNALNTSDLRLKTDVAPSSLGLDFINQLNPVQYRWIEGGNTVEKVQTGTETVEITPAIPAQPEVLDEEGNVIQEATQEVPAVTEEKPIYETVVTPREGVRTHFGLIAQEVKAALPDGLDFAGWCLADKDDADSTQSLGYTQLIAPMIKAIQELNAKVEALEAQLNK